MNARLVDAADEFFDALKGIVDPEEKRKAFRNTSTLSLQGLCERER
jgi:GMP synthase PP-ATPase subunit